MFHECVLSGRIARTHLRGERYFREVLQNLRRHAGDFAESTSCTAEVACVERRANARADPVTDSESSFRREQKFFLLVENITRTLRVTLKRHRDAPCRLCFTQERRSQWRGAVRL